MRTGRRISILTTALLLVATATATRSAGQERRLNIAFVSMERAFSEYHKTRIADGQLRAQAEEFNRERQAMVEEIRGAEERINTAREEAGNVALSEDARDRRRAEVEEQLVDLREMESRLRRFDELRSKQLEDQGRRMRRGLVQEIRDVIRDYARTHNLDAVIDASGQSVSGIEAVLYLDSRADVTDAILAILNRDAPGE